MKRYSVKKSRTGPDVWYVRFNGFIVAYYPTWKDAFDYAHFRESQRRGLDREFMVEMILRNAVAKRSMGGRNCW